MQLLLLLLLDLYPVKMNTSRNPPSLLFCESGYTLTTCTSHSKGSKWTSKKKGGGKKQHAGYICKFCELGHTAVPYGVKAQGHAAGTNQREKTLRLLLWRDSPHAQGLKTKPDSWRAAGEEIPKTGISSKRKKNNAKT